MGATTIGIARAQQSAKQYRIAILDIVTPVQVMNESAHPHHPIWAPLFEELRRLGYVEGQNLTVERVGIGDYSRDVARRVVADNPDVIFADTDAVVHDVATMTSTVPIVGFASYFGAPSALIANPAHPGGNLTGVGAGPTIELIGKRLELLREMVPGMSRVGAIYLRENWERIKPDFEKTATRHTFPDFCARALVIVPRSASPATKSRRLIRSPRRRWQELKPVW
jgi:putative tryptophan/tyrosine transport system substrate-binding protein